MSPRFDKWSYGGYFLSKRHNSPNWHRCWFDKKRKQTRAASLGTGDLDEAKRRLIAWVHENAKIDTTRADELALWEVMQRYDFAHVRHNATHAGKQTQRSALAKMRDFAGDVTVLEFDHGKQQEIVRKMKAAGYSDAYVKRIFSATYAALNWAAQNGELDRRPVTLKLPNSPHREYFATPAELAKLWDALPQAHLRMFFVLAISTGARAGAIVELTTFQCDLQHGLIDLNTPGRSQTKKRRPVVPMTDLARRWIEGAPPGRLVQWQGRPVRHVHTSWDAARKRAGLPPQLHRHAIRHTVASWCRMNGVDRWLTDAFFGWSGAGMADRYAKYDPNYFRPVVEALDRLASAIADNAETSLYEVPRASSVRGSLENGAGEAIRTPDPHLGKVMLYP